MTTKMNTMAINPHGDQSVDPQADQTLLHGLPALVIPIILVARLRSAESDKSNHVGGYDE